MNAAHQKVAASHLSRDAYLYVRQSTQRQVFDHGESTRRQYALRERAVALGWPTESIVVIDSDLGLSGADCQRRRKNVPARRRKSVPRARWQLVPADPRAGPCALRAAGGGPRVGGPVGPRGQAGGYSDGCRRRDRLCLSR